MAFIKVIGLGEFRPPHSVLSYMKRPRKHTLRTQRLLRISLWGFLALIFATKTYFTRPLTMDRLKLKKQSMIEKSQSKVCICLADDRFSPQDLQIAALGSIEELTAFAHTQLGNTLELKYWQKTAIINTAYALKFGHDIIMTDLSAYRNIYTEPRPSVWLKPAFMQDVLQTRPDCDWFASIDSDAYLWMFNHTVGLWDWFSTGSVQEATFRYYEFEHEKRRRGGFYDWDEQSAFLFIGLNGVFSNPHEGYPNLYEDNYSDFICAGVYFIQNSLRSKQFMQDWVAGPVDSSGEERAVLHEFALKFSFEQRVLNAVLYPRYKDGIQIYSYRDFGSKDGPLIRHTWSQFYQERDPLMNKDLVALGV